MKDSIREITQIPEPMMGLDLSDKCSADDIFRRDSLENKTR